MSDNSRDYTSRRKLLSAIGAGSLVSLSGCTETREYFGDSSPEYADPNSSIDGLTLNQISQESVSDPYTVAVSDDVMSSEDYSLFNGQQVRVKVSTDSGSTTLPALYTITTDPSYTSESENSLWMTSDGIKRINTSGGATVDLIPYSTSPIYFDRESGRTNSEFIEQANDSDSSVLFVAPHGGNLSAYTELQAFRGSSEQNYCVWSALGYADSPELARERWYNPEEKYSISSFVRLQELEPPFNRVISFVGHESPIKQISIGGLGESQVKELLEQELRYVFFGEGESVAAPPESQQTEESEDNSIPSGIDDAVNVSIKERGEQAGVDPQLISNQLSDSGAGTLRISQSDSVREEYWSEIANAVVRVIEYIEG